MPRRRHFLDRPHAHLRAAADVHARLAGGELAETPVVDGDDGGASSTSGRRKSGQPRDNSSGRFK